MIQITLTQKGHDKALDRMSDEELYDAGRSAWVLGKAADRERYTLIAHSGKVQMAVEIEDLVTTEVRDLGDTRDNRRAIVGIVLKPGHPVYDDYVGQDMKGTRNPIRYFDSVHDRKGCLCDCGEDVARGDFLPGHDQRAIHVRIAKIGTVAQFIQWFDSNFHDAA